MAFPGSPSNPHHRLLLALFAFASVGVGAELGLLGHYEDYKQYAPLILLGLGLAAVLWTWLAPGRRSVRVFQGLMVLFVVGGVVGLVLHYRANAEFELEVYPAMAGWRLVWESLRGATPALAPGTMVQLGLLGMLATFRHPAITQAATRAQPPQGDRPQ